MRTDRAQAVLRPRTGLEAVDLGVRLARASWRPLALTWIAIVLPIGAAPVLALREHPVIALVLLWWLRPAFARVPLHVLARAFFGEIPSLPDTVRALPALARSGLGTSLVLQRFSPARTMLLPVLQLEGLRGRARRERCAVLARRDLGAAAALLAVGAHMNAVLGFGLVALLAWMVPDELAWDVFELFGPFFEDASDDPGQMLVPALYLLGTSVVEPLLVAGGFGLYVNRRVFLEGWDIDLAFRALARRVAAPGAPGGPQVGAAARRAAAALVALALIAPAAAPAQQAAADPALPPACVPADPRSANACAEAVLAAPDFGSVREVEFWAPRRFDLEGPELSLDALAWLGPLLASLFEVMLWVSLAVVAIALIAAFARVRSGPRAPAAAAPPAPVLFGPGAAPEPLPDDLLGAARERWARGAQVEALSLLYRGALARLEALEVPASATERECVRLVRRARPGEPARVFAALADAWMAARYGHRPPDDAHFEELCRRFGPAFGSGPA